LPQVPGFALDVKKGSVTFPDGSKNGKLSVTVVNNDKVPMSPPNGMQPQFIVTIQPVGARFEPPATLTLPNVDGYKPGAEVEMFSYDHDLEEFVTIGWGTVSNDGATIKSNPGVGVVKAGWHCGAAPGGSGSAAECGECRKCNGQDCVNDDGQTPTSLADIPKDCLKPGCRDGSPTQVPDKDDVPFDPPENCLGVQCINGQAFPVIDDDDKPKDEFGCKSCEGGKIKPLTGNPCDDNLYCTSADGKAPGPDNCNNGRCTGHHIDRQKISELASDVNVSKLLEVLAQVEPVFPGLSIKSQSKTLTVKECCESQKKMLTSTGLEEAGVVELKVQEFASPPAVWLSPAGPINFRLVGKFSIQGKGFYTRYVSTCNDPGQCNDQGGFQLGGVAEGGIEASYINPNVVSVTGSLRGQAYANYTAKCENWRGCGCAGPLEGRLVLSLLSGVFQYSGSLVIPGTTFCTSGCGSAPSD